MGSGGRCFDGNGKVDYEEEMHRSCGTVAIDIESPPADGGRGTATGAREDAGLAPVSIDAGEGACPLEDAKNLPLSDSCTIVQSECRPCGGDGRPYGAAFNCEGLARPRAYRADGGPAPLPGCRPTAHVDGRTGFCCEPAECVRARERDHECLSPARPVAWACLRGVAPDGCTEVAAPGLTAVACCGRVP